MSFTYLELTRTYNTWIAKQNINRVAKAMKTSVQIKITVGVFVKLRSHYLMGTLRSRSCSNPTPWFKCSDNNKNNNDLENKLDKVNQEPEKKEIKPEKEIKSDY